MSETEKPTQGQEVPGNEGFVLPSTGLKIPMPNVKPPAAPQTPAPSKAK